MTRELRPRARLRLKAGDRAQEIMFGHHGRHVKNDRGQSGDQPHQ